MQKFDLNQYPKLAGKEESFKALVSSFIERLAPLSAELKDKLAFYKAMELANALVQIREKEEAENRLGAEKAAASSRMARAAIRERQIDLPGGEIISFKEPELAAIIDEGARAFHGGKQDKDSELWQKAMALSTAQYIVLNKYLGMRLMQVYDYFSDLYPQELISEIRDRFISPYGDNK